MAEQILLSLIGLSSGMVVSGGVFTVLVSVGMIPRFAGKTHTNRKVFLYEEAVVWGTILGGLISIYGEKIQLAVAAEGFFSADGLRFLGDLVLIAFGLFAGIFVGCLALAIAEMLDSIPIFSRRIGFRHGLGLAILGVALGKLAGSLVYFSQQVFLHGG